MKKKITGLILRTQGIVIATDKRKSIIKWIERSSRGRTYYYLVYLQGSKYIRPYRLQSDELQSWKDNIERTNMCGGKTNGRTKNNTKF